MQRSYGSRKGRCRVSRLGCVSGRLRMAILRPGRILETFKLEAPRTFQSRDTSAAPPELPNHEWILEPSKRGVNVTWVILDFAAVTCQMLPKVTITRRARLSACADANC